MSSNEKIKYPKNSFDRFGDDLTELILANLNLETKIQLECLSRQWRRLIFTNQNQLTIDNKFITKAKARDRLFRLDAIESVLTKCPNITSISVQRGQHSIANLEQVYELILKCCHRLYAITAVSRTRQLSDDLNQRFFTKFGPKLKSISFFNPNENLKRFRDIIRLCPQLESIKSPNLKLYQLFDENQVLVKCLKTFGYRFSLDDNQRLDAFVTNNKNSLESLSLDMSDHTSDDADFQIYSHLVGLTRLRSLRLTYDGVLTSAHHDNFVNYVKQTAHNCPDIVKLDIEMYGEDYKTVRQTYQSLLDFKNLRYLRFNGSDIHKTPDQIESLELFESKKLIHLEIMLSFAPMNDKFFASIAHNMPKLQAIHCEHLDITDKSLQAFAQLTDLKDIFLDWNRLKDKFNDSVVLEIIRKCRKLKTMFTVNHGIKTKLLESDICQMRRLQTEEWQQFLAQHIESRHISLE